MEDLLLFIPYVNRPDLLEASLRAAEPLWSRTVVIDNSDGPALNVSNIKYSIFRPPVPLGFSQTQNLIQRFAKGSNLKLFLILHSDAYCAPQDMLRFVEFARGMKKENWGAIFTNYDVLVCFNPVVIDRVGPWDWRGLPWYFADTDYYRRIGLSGLSIEPCSEINVEHFKSQTHLNDPLIEAAVLAHHDQAERYYTWKWGGKPGQEKFEQPFNGDVVSVVRERIKSEAINYPGRKA